MKKKVSRRLKNRILVLSKTERLFFWRRSFYTILAWPKVEWWVVLLVLFCFFTIPITNGIGSEVLSCTEKKDQMIEVRLGTSSNPFYVHRMGLIAKASSLAWSTWQNMLCVCKGIKPSRKINTQPKNARLKHRFRRDFSVLSVRVKRSLPGLAYLFSFFWVSELPSLEMFHWYIFYVPTTP